MMTTRPQLAPTTAQAPVAAPIASSRWSHGSDNIPRILPRRPNGGLAEQKGGDDAPQQFQILIIDPQPLTRNCLIAAMEDAASISGIVAVSDADGAKQLIGEGMEFDAAILNLDQGPVDGNSLSIALMPVLMVLPNTPLLLLASGTKPSCLTIAFDLGVRGYLTTDTALSITLEAIRLVCAGWMIYPAFRQDETPRLLSGFGQREDGAAIKLTPRQEQVLQCLATGMPNKTIAFHLKMSESTVKAHVKEIMQRVGAANRTQVVALIGRNDGQGH